MAETVAELVAPRNIADLFRALVSPPARSITGLPLTRVGTAIARGWHLGGGTKFELHLETD